MALASKGSTWTVGIGTAGASLASLLSIDGPEIESETFESDTLDNASAGIPYQATGRVEGGKISAEGFLSSANKSAALALIASLASGSSGTSVISYGPSGSAVTFTSAIAGFSCAPSAALKDGVKCKFSGKVSGNVT
jgi:hypothetical protein